jgi:hypothetical protein
MLLAHSTGVAHSADRNFQLVLPVKQRVLDLKIITQRSYTVYQGAELSNIKPNLKMVLAKAKTGECREYSDSVLPRRHQC